MRWRKPNGVPLFIFAGQSNSRGVYLTTANVPSYLRVSDPRICIWSPLRTQWETLNNGVNNVDNTGYGTGGLQNWGAEAEFTYRWRQDNPNRTCYILKFEFIGSLEPYTTQDDWNAASTGEYFDIAVSRINAAKAALAAQGLRARVGAIMWMQGENESSRGLEIASRYQDQMRDFFWNVRARWGDDRTRVIVGRISAYSGWADGATIRACQARYVASDSLARLVDTDSYPMQADNFHYNAAGQVSLGADMYAAYKTTL